MNAEAKSLVRKLLVKVHPDVVGSHSSTYRVFNEANLKSLLNVVNGRTKPARVQFYREDGSKTSTALIDSKDPVPGLKVLLGVSTPFRKPEPVRGERMNQQRFRRVFAELLERWKERSPGQDAKPAVHVMFETNRVRFCEDAQRPRVRDSDPFDLSWKKENAVNLICAVFTRLSSKTQQALVNTKACERIQIVLYESNLRHLSFNEQDFTLLVPLHTDPEQIALGLERVVERAMEEEGG